jgi:hypothetical protein
MQKFALTGYIQVILYEDELADSGISFLTVSGKCFTMILMSWIV